MRELRAANWACWELYVCLSPSLGGVLFNGRDACTAQWRRVEAAERKRRVDAL